MSILTLSLSAGLALADNFRDFSESSPEHKILRGIKLDALNVDFIEKRPIDVRGTLVDASVFFVRTSITVPFFAEQNSNVMKDINGFYDLIVAEDQRRQIHNSLIESIHDSIARAAAWKDFGFVTGKSSYMVSVGPAKLPELVWIGEKVILARLRRFSEKRADLNNDVETFWKDKIRFDLDGSRVRIESPKKAIREQFLQLYKDGAFSRKSS